MPPRPLRVVPRVVVALALAALGAASPSRADAYPGFFPGELRSGSDRSAEGPHALVDHNGDPTQCGQVTYCGGPVISNVQFVPVFWTDQVTASTQAWVEGYAQALTGSALMDMLSEYSTVGLAGAACAQPSDAGVSYFGPAVPSSTGQTITRGTALPAVTITPTKTTGTTITDDNAVIGEEIVAQIAAGHLPAPTYDAQGYPNTLYVVFFPLGTTINLLGLQSCQTFGGYHNSVAYSAPAACKGQYLPYAVIPDCGPGYEGSGLSVVVSHELAEAVTDTDVGPTSTTNAGDGAWYLGPSVPCPDPNSCPMSCGEVGDACEQQGNDGTVPGTSIDSQDIWSQAQNECALSNPAAAPRLAPPTGPTSCTSGSGGDVPDAGRSSGGGGSGSSGGGESSGGSSGGGGNEGSSSGSGGAAPSRDGGVASSNEDPSAASSPDSAGFDKLGNAGCGCALAGAGGAGYAAPLGALLALALTTRSRQRRSRRR